MITQQTNKTFTATNIILLVTVLMYFVQNNIQHGDLLFGLNIYFFTQEFYHQLLTTMFVHGGFAHILMNMFVLFQFGNVVEHHIGVRRFLILYFVGGLLTSIGSLAYIYFTGSFNVNLVGASGAISVILGWLALRDSYQRNGIIIWVLLISFLPLLLGLPVAWYAHLIGFVLGWLMGYIL